MANPRKFSEKIALQRQKQAEGTAEFEKIMKEVSDATSKQDDLHANRLVECAISNSSSTNTTPVHRESRGRSVGVGPMRRPSDRRVDTSPYSSNSAVYLSPPSDSFWRRANSDSAIHQSLTNSSEKRTSHSPTSLSPTSQRRFAHIKADNRYNLGYKNSLKNSSNIDVRQSSQNRLSKIPNINAYQSSHENTLSAPIGNNTGSLPDLTSVRIAPCLNTHLNKNLENSNSPYSSSPITVSPIAYSPTSMQARYQFSPANSPSDSGTFSPTHFSSNARLRYLTIPGNECSSQQYQNEDTSFDNQLNSQPATHLSFTNLPNLIHVHQNNNRGVNISNNDNSNSSSVNIPSIGVAGGNLTEYRIPQSRPSPGSSPGLTIPYQQNDSSTSAPSSPVPQAINSSSNNQNYDKFQSQNNDGYSLNQSFQNHFEQFSLVDNTTDYLPNIQRSQNNFTTLQFDDSTFAQLDSLSNSPSQQSLQNQSLNRGSYNVQDIKISNKTDINVTNSTNLRLGPNCNYQNHISQSLGGESQLSHNQSGYQGSNTPTSIPEIVFSDFSTGNPDFQREIFGSLDLELGPIDVAGLQMLSDPNASMIADPTIEDSFRRDLN